MRYNPRVFSPLHTMEKGDSTTVDIELTSKEKKGKAPLLAASFAAGRGNVGQEKVGGGRKKGVAIFDLALRLAALVAALTATIVMGTTDQTLPFFTQFFQFQASYDDLPAFKFFVIANAIVSAYLVLSIPFSIVCIVRPHAAGPRLLLIILDTVMVTLTTSAAAAAAAIVYLAHSGNSSANWLPICQQFNDFCQKVSGAVVASFITAAIFIFMIVLSGFAL